MLDSLLSYKCLLCGKLKKVLFYAQTCSLKQGIRMHVTTLNGFKTDFVYLKVKATRKDTNLVSEDLQLSQFHSHNFHNFTVNMLDITIKR